MIDTLNVTQATIEAALAGDGVALEWLRICAPDLAEGVTVERKNRTYQLPVQLVADVAACAAGHGVPQSHLVEFALLYVLGRVAAGELVLPVLARTRTLDMRAAK